MTKARDGIEDLKTIDANLAAKAPLASPSFTGTGSVNGKLVFFDGNTQTRNGGVATEANAALINFGLNEGSGNRFGGSYNQASQGGMLNFDTRANQPLFQIYGRAAGVAEATGTALLNIDSSGRVTKPLQPSFRVGSVTYVTSGTLVKHTIDFHDIGNNYNPANGRFTAPIAGVYYFGAQAISGSATASSEQQIMFLKNDAGICDARARGYTESSLHLKTVIQLAAGDYITVFVGSGSVYAQSNGFHNQFMGHLIG